MDWSWRLHAPLLTHIGQSKGWLARRNSMILSRRDLSSEINIPEIF